MISITTPTLIFGCARHNGKSEGGQDGGGGHVRLSSVEEVKGAIALALSLASDKNYRTNVYVAFLNDQRHGYAYEHETAEARAAKSKRLFRIVFGNEKIYCFTYYGEEKPYGCGEEFDKKEYELYPPKFTSHLSEVLAASKVRLEMNGDCPSSTNDHADASVSAYSIGAEICFSVRNLTRIPPTSLAREVSSLLLHEIAHLHGYLESDAVELQDDYAEFFEFRFGAARRFRIQGLVDESLQEIHRLIEMAKLIRDDKKQFDTYVGQAISILTELPYWDNPLGIKFAYEKAPLPTIERFSYEVALDITRLRAWQMDGLFDAEVSDLILSNNSANVIPYMERLVANIENIWAEVTLGQKDSSCFTEFGLLTSEFGTNKYLSERFYAYVMLYESLDPQYYPICGDIFGRPRQ